MQKGDLVAPMFRATNDGRPVPMGLCELLEKIGTVPDFWKVRRLDPSCAGQVVTCFVHPEDLIKKEESPRLRIVRSDETQN